MRNRLFFLVLVAMIGISAVLASNYPTRMYLIGDGAPQKQLGLKCINMHGNNSTWNIYMDR